MTAGSAAYGRVCPMVSELNSDRNSYTTLGDVSAASPTGAESFRGKRARCSGVWPLQAPTE